MPNYFAVTAVTTTIELDAERKGQASFTVTNATQSAIGGDALVEPQPGGEALKFEVDRPSRRYDPGATEQVSVKVSAPPEVPEGTYWFVLRVVLSGGVPEEQYDDGPVVTFEVKETPGPIIVEKTKRKIPWRLIALILGIIAIVVIGVLIWMFWPRSDNGVRVDFETSPPTANAEVRNPYRAAGVTFTTLTPGGVVGIVKNRATTACVEPADDNFKLGTAVTPDASNVGKAGHAIRADFSPPLTPPTDGLAKISVQFQAMADVDVRLRLFGTNNTPIKETTMKAAPAAGDCDFTGGPRARVTVSADSTIPVVFAVVDVTGGGPFVIDEFTYEPMNWPVGAIPASEAIHNVGKELTVCGVVVSSKWTGTGETGLPTFLNIDSQWPNLIFNVVIWGEERRTWLPNAKPDAFYPGKRVCVNGAIEQFGSWAQMQNVSIDDIQVLP